MSDTIAEYTVIRKNVSKITNEIAELDRINKILRFQIQVNEDRIEELNNMLKQNTPSGDNSVKKLEKIKQVIDDYNHDSGAMGMSLEYWLGKIEGVLEDGTDEKIYK